MFQELGIKHRIGWNWIKGVQIKLVNIKENIIFKCWRRTHIFFWSKFFLITYLQCHWKEGRYLDRILGKVLLELSKMAEKGLIREFRRQFFIKKREDQHKKQVKTNCVTCIWATILVLLNWKRKKHFWRNIQFMKSGYTGNQFREFQMFNYIQLQRKFKHIRRTYHMSPRYRTEMPVQSVQSVKSQSNIFAAEVFSRNVSLVNAS